jgi:hypothetical protein
MRMFVAVKTPFSADPFALTQSPAFTADKATDFVAVMAVLPV